MASMKTKLATTAILLLLGITITNFVTPVTAQAKRAANLDADLDYEEESEFKKAAAGSQRAAPVKAAKVESHIIEYKFEDELWLPRGSLEVSLDAQGKIIALNIKNNDIASTKDEFKSDLEAKCKENKLY